MTTFDIAEMLGGGQVFVGRVIRSELDLLAAVRDGLPARAVDAVVERSGLSRGEVEGLVFAGAVPPRPRTLTLEESDRLARVARIAALAAETIGDTGRAAVWLRTGNRALDGAAPIALLTSGEGARLAEETLLRIAHGVFA
jgi:putative toxin-antitoxin system antitoxin component (TIGR02293 family)